MPRYPIVIEKGRRNYSAYAPDVPGCVATGSTVEETTEQMAAALAFHLEGLQMDGERLPTPGEALTFVEV